MMKTFIFGILVLVNLVKGKQIDLPIPCKENDDCLDTITNQTILAFCRNSYCICLNEYLIERNCSSIDRILSSDEAAVPLTHHPCKLNIQCNFEHGYCNTTRSQCDCMNGYLLSTDQNHCLEVARSLGFPCSSEKQCLSFQPNTTCQNQQCVCINGYHAVDNKCWRIAKFGTACTKLHECSHIKDGFCTENKICGCENNAVISTPGDKCLPIAKAYLDECLEDKQCSTKFMDSLCINMTCTCSEKYHFESDLEKCIINKVGNTCNNSDECYQLGSLPKRMLQCIDNRCACPDDYQQVGERCIEGHPTESSVACSFGPFILKIPIILLPILFQNVLL